MDRFRLIKSEQVLDDNEQTDAGENQYMYTHQEETRPHGRLGIDHCTGWMIAVIGNLQAIPHRLFDGSKFIRLNGTSFTGYRIELNHRGIPGRLVVGQLFNVIDNNAFGRQAAFSQPAEGDHFSKG